MDYGKKLKLECNASEIDKKIIKELHSTNDTGIGFKLIKKLENKELGELRREHFILCDVGYEQSY